MSHTTTMKALAGQRTFLVLYKGSVVVAEVDTTWMSQAEMTAVLRDRMASGEVTGFNVAVRDDGEGKGMGAVNCLSMWNKIMDEAR